MAPPLTDGLLRVLSYNIHKGFRAGNRAFILPDIRAHIRETGAQLVFLQEVLGEHSGHRERVDGYPTESQFEFLADSVWPHFAYGKNAVYSEGHHGNALLSQYPIRSWRNINLSTNRFEQRGLLHAIVDVPGAESVVHAFSLHLNLLDGGRQVQIRKVMDYIRQHVPAGERIVLGGDFNDWREKISDILDQEAGIAEVHRSLHGHHAVSFPSFWPLLRLDRIYYRGLTPRSARCLGGGTWSRLSDHLALQADFEL
ncbi:MAG: endonuclease/exonuclease/phosphatase family protein [Bdellovibrionales bacterium]|nr:endonuclease/exonuclease/phosphatase family protein [Bdellovibrionales bacterium]